MKLSKSTKFKHLKKVEDSKKSENSSVKKTNDHQMPIGIYVLSKVYQSSLKPAKVPKNFGPGTGI